jgi:ABC-2 type transport system ATP-binding protein
VEGLDGIRGVETRGDELVVTAVNGAATIGNVAVALNTVALVRTLTLRTPTLDDVFLELTGNHIQSDDALAGAPDRDETDRCEILEVVR